MDFNNLFNQVLDFAKEQVSQVQNGNVSLDSLTSGLGNGLDSLKNLDSVTKIGGGAALTGILSMILGRSGGSSLAKLGSLAVLGNLAYKAYQSYQQSQNGNQTAEISQAEFENHSAENDHGTIILRTMIAAAASDGEITEQEKQLIISENQDNAELQQWLAQEVENPISAQEIANAVGNDQALAAKVYLAARIACQDLSRKEIVFLSQLADALGLNEQLIEQLEKQAGF